jgi:hypothetical protein
LFLSHGGSPSANLNGGQLLESCGTDLRSDSCIHVLQTRIHHLFRSSETLLGPQPRLLSGTGRRPWKSYPLATLDTFPYIGSSLKPNYVRASSQCCSARRYLRNSEHLGQARRFPIRRIQGHSRL